MRAARPAGAARTPEKVFSHMEAPITGTAPRSATFPAPAAPENQENQENQESQKDKESPSALTFRAARTTWKSRCSAAT